jgi:hypothetical protein
LLSPTERSLRGRLGAFRLHATHSPFETTVAARAAFRSRFEEEVDPDHVLSEGERARRAEAARKAFYTRLALKSVQVRRERKARKNGGQVE